MTPAHEIQRQAAGSASVYFVAILDVNRRVTRRLSGFAGTTAEALAFLKWARRRHPGAVLMRQLTFLEEVSA